MQMKGEIFVIKAMSMAGFNVVLKVHVAAGASFHWLPPSYFLLSSPSLNSTDIAET